MTILVNKDCEDMIFMNQTCARCIYDETIPYIYFDSEGVCNYCRQHELLEQEYPTGKEGEKLIALAEQIKIAGKNKKYDVIVGISGGCDSSYLLYKTKELGLRPLAVHFDNTWNSKIAVENIHNILKKLDVDLYTHVVDAQEFNDILKSFIKASVPEIDTPSDIGLATTHYLAAEKYGIKYIFEGHSFRTEGIAPQGWSYMDGKYIQTVHDKYGTGIKIETFPNLWLAKWLKWLIINQIKKIRPLYYIDYKKDETKEFLSKELGWQWYGGHHMENRIAYFLNNYWYPKKFGIDLRYSEFSALVRTGQMKREEALDKIKTSNIFDESILEEIKKRLSITDEEFEMMMKAPNKSYRDYKTYKQTFEKMRGFFWLLYKADLVPKSFYMKYTRKYEK